MRAWAATAVGLMAACSGKILTIGPPDEFRPGAGTLDAAEGLPTAPEDANDGALHDGVVLPDGGDASPPQECANETIPPSTLACTGLYTDILAKTVAPGVRFYQPAVSLWSDGAEKKRWIWLPPGTQIEVSNPNEWTFPIGTKLFKEFSKYGKRIETRFFQKIGNGPPPVWVHAAYAWNADESAATTSAGGSVTVTSDGGTWYIPTFSECDQCHNGRTDSVLGFEQVSLGQQGAEVDGGMTLSELADEGLLVPAPTQTHLAVGDDGTGAAAPALAWIHINCGVTCHNGNVNATAYGVGMRLRLDPTFLDGGSLQSSIDPLSTTIGVTARSPGWIQPTQWTRIVPGDADGSLLFQLISHRGTDGPAMGQMPPIASSIVDFDDVAKVQAWIQAMPADGGLEGGASADATLNAAREDASLGD